MSNAQFIESESPRAAEVGERHPAYDSLRDYREGEYYAEHEEGLNPESGKLESLHEEQGVRIHNKTMGGKGEKL